VATTPRAAVGTRTHPCHGTSIPEDLKRVQASRTISETTVTQSANLAVGKRTHVPIIASFAFLRISFLHNRFKIQDCRMTTELTFRDLVIARTFI
jgi:hypothetical protein